MASVIKGALQIGFFIAFSWCMNRLTAALHWNIPGSILGIVVLFVLLQLKIVKLTWIDLGAKWLIAEMLLFFIPPTVGIVQYKALMVDSGARILLVVIGSIFVVMTGTGLIAERLAKHKEAGTS